MSDTDGITRRTLIGGAAATAAIAAVPAAAEGARRRGVPTRRADVIVVGAGLAGLTAARELARAHRSVLVLEARDRVGGRTLNASIGGGEIVEVGGQWIGAGKPQARMGALARAVGVKTFKTYTKGTSTLEYQGKLTPFTGVFPPIPKADSDEFLQVTLTLESLARQVPLDRPWTAARGAEWDGMTAESWKRENVRTPGAQAVFDLLVRSVFAAEPRDISFLHFLWYGHSGGGFIYLGSNEGGAQDSRFVGGSQLVSTRVARQLGARVRLGEPVSAIEQTRGGVRVTTAHGRYEGRRVIVAVPPTLAARIDYDPLLPAQRDQLTQRMPMGSVIKCEAVYDRPFWRDEGRSAYVNRDVGPLRLMYDNSPPDGRPGVLLGFAVGTDARRLAQRSPAARRRAALADFAHVFGPRAAHPRRYVDHVWADEEYTRGCYGAHMPPGVWSDFGDALRRPVGRIHWAGTETATVSSGYMDGAVRSGERAAREVR